MITWLQVPRPMYTGVFGIDWITDTLKTIREEGASRYLGRISQPYVDAAARHLDPGSPAHTPRLIRRLLDQVPTSGPDTNNITDVR